LDFHRREKPKTHIQRTCSEHCPGFDPLVHKYSVHLSISDAASIDDSWTT
jgi:hypothetical protein